jgi:hypothetical protein
VVFFCRGRRRTDSYTYGTKFKVSDAINLPGPGAMYIRSPTPSNGDLIYTVGGGVVYRAALVRIWVV